MTAAPVFLNCTRPASAHKWSSMGVVFADFVSASAGLSRPRTKWTLRRFCCTRCWRNANRSFTCFTRRRSPYMAVMLWADCESVKSSIFKEWCCVLGQPRASKMIPFLKVSSKHPIHNSSLGFHHGSQLRLGRRHGWHVLLSRERLQNNPLVTIRWSVTSPWGTTPFGFSPS